MVVVHPKQQLDGTGIKPKRSFGQNFLADETHLKRIAALALERARDTQRTVVEMGAGLGALTQHLVDAGATVHAVERDRELVPLLLKRFEGARPGALTVHEDNALTFSLDVVAAGGAIAGNLPYHHAAQLALRVLDAWPKLGGACFLVQLEVAERMAATPGNKDFGSLSVVLQSRFDVRLAPVVPKGAFWPVPEVDGGVVSFDPLPAPRGAEHTLPELEKVVRAAFQQRRKTVRNGLKSVLGAAVDDVLKDVGIAPQTRAEDIDVAAWGRLAHAAARLHSG
jgi:16S rRNA (adenine1518-N6/adenine1519-N6)-dimethyltransferase